MQPTPVNPEPSSTGLDPKVAGLLCYLGVFVTGIIFLIMEKQSRFVKFHAFQSIVLFGGLTAVNLVLGMIPIIGWIVNIILWPVGFILWIAMMLLALQGSKFKLPYIGQWIEDQANRF